MTNNINQKGFTILELLIGVAIIGVIVLSFLWLGDGIGSFIDNKNDTRGRGDAEVGKVDNEKRTVYQMPDRFGNVAMFCDEYGNAVYTTTSDPNRSLHTLKDGCE